MIEPGTRLSDRYLLETLVTETGGAALWKATDETLARAVAVWTFAPGFPRTREVVLAARSASRIPDARLTQVFDADDSGNTAYVVEEWVAGTSLTNLLANGPLEPDRAGGLVAEAAEALAAAHSAGSHHLRLSPDKLIWSTGGAVKVTGVAVDAAIRGITAVATPTNGAGPTPEADAATGDAVGLGQLLYVALTAHWPGPEPTGLPAAPTLSGAPCQPSQVRAGIPQDLDDIVCRAAFQRSQRGQPPLRTAQDVADALAHVPRLVPIPEAATPVPPPARSAPRGGSRRTTQTAAAPAAPAPPRRERRERHTRRSTSSLNLVLIGAVAMLVLVAVVVAAWNVGSLWNASDSNATADGDDNTPPVEEIEPADLEDLTPVGAQDFDPGGDGEHGDRAGNGIDGDTSTQWNTEGYTSPQFGNLKDGVGLAVDLGESAQVQEIDLTLGSNGPVNLEIRVGDEVSLGGMETVHSQDGASGELPIRLDSPAEGRYVLIWFTELAQDGSQYRAIVHDVNLRGSA